MNHKTFVYVDLPEEETPTLYKTPAEALGNGLYKLHPPHNYDPEDSIMQFLPGAIVRCVEKNNGGDLILLAVEQAG